MYTAFQADAFQNDAFQVRDSDAADLGGVSGLPVFDEDEEALLAIALAFVSAVEEAR